VLVHLSKNDKGQFSFNPISVNLMTEVFKVVSALIVLLILVSSNAAAATAAAAAAAAAAATTAAANICRDASQNLKLHPFSVGDTASYSQTTSADCKQTMGRLAVAAGLSWQR
jgi:hypothetical protein